MEARSTIFPVCGSDFGVLRGMRLASWSIGIAKIDSGYGADFARPPSVCPTDENLDTDFDSHCEACSMKRNSTSKVAKRRERKRKREGGRAADNRTRRKAY